LKPFRFHFRKTLLRFDNRRIVYQSRYSSHAIIDFLKKSFNFLLFRNVCFDGDSFATCLSNFIYNICSGRIILVIINANLIISLGSKVCVEAPMP
jgi:hypothetical protein